MTVEQLLKHANRFDFELKPGVSLNVYRVEGGYIAQCSCDTVVAEGGGFLVTDEMLQYQAMYLRHDGTLAHGTQVKDPQFYFNDLPTLLLAARLLPDEWQRDCIEHSLGLDPRRPKRGPYRRHYCTTKGDPKLEEMVTKGWMQRGQVINDGRDQYYHVTEAGAGCVGQKLPKER